MKLDATKRGKNRKANRRGDRESVLLLSGGKVGRVRGVCGGGGWLGGGGVVSQICPCWTFSRREGRRVKLKVSRKHSEAKGALQLTGWNRGIGGAGGNSL